MKKKIKRWVGHGGARPNSGSTKGQKYNVTPTNKASKTVTIDKEILGQLEQLAERENRSFSNLIETIARDYLQNYLRNVSPPQTTPSND